MKRKPNTQECSFLGRKLSSIVVTNIELILGSYIAIGSENDDSIYSPDITGEPTLKERVTVTVFHEDDSLDPIEFDLEDILRFSAKYCRGIVERVLLEEKKYE